MTTFTEKFNAYFSAAAFAEAGEHETALQMVRAVDARQEKKSTILENLRRTFAAVAFAEEGLHAEARAILEPAPATSRKTWCAEDSFLDLVGLQHVRVRHMVLQV